MGRETDVISVALEVGQKILMHAQGDPARTVAYGVAAAAATLGVAIGYGGYVYGRKFGSWLLGE